MEKQEKYCFGTSEERCGTDTFDSIEELISFADSCYKDADGNYWDEDADDYPEVIYIGITHEIKAKDYAPTLEEIADEMTDAFYSKWNVDEDERVRFYKEAQEGLSRKTLRCLLTLPRRG